MFILPNVAIDCNIHAVSLTYVHNLYPQTSPSCLLIIEHLPPFEPDGATPLSIPG